MSGTSGSSDLIVAIRHLSRERSRLDDRASGLPDAEQAEAARYIRRDDRDRFLLGRLLLRETIASATGRAAADITLARDGNGRPFTPDVPEIDINLSHSGDCIAAVVGRGLSVGIDVELHRSGIDIAAIGRQVFTPHERAHILAAGSGSVAAFFRQWTLKEALVKALGRGFLDDPRRIEIRHETGGVFTPVFVGEGPDDLGSGWTLRLLDCGDDHAGALAFRPRLASG